MRSGISHLRKKVAGEGGDTYVSSDEAGEVMAESEPRVPNAECELDAPIWSLVSFGRCEAGGLTYRQASHLMTELDAAGVPGLCIVTDAAANRVKT